MRILIHGLNFAPELVGVGKYTGEMAEWLAGRGHQVRAVTAPPFNPQWQVAAGFSSWRYARDSRRTVTREKIDSSKSEPLFPQNQTGAAAAGDLTVLRCPVWVPLQPSAGKRLLHLASFALSSFLVMLRQSPWKPEVVFVVEPTLFCLPAALLTGRFSGAKTWLHIQDFEADASFELGLLKSPWLKIKVEKTEKKFMSAFGRVSTISENMRAKLARKGVAGSACRLFPNWVDTRAIFPLSTPSPLRSRLGISTGQVVALYAGTMARKQGLEIMAEAASRLAAHPKLRFVFAGEGPGRAGLEQLTRTLPNVQWIPLQPLDGLNDLLNLADIHLMPQKAGAADLVMPSKLTGMLASGRPVIATADRETQLARVVESRGIVVRPGDAKAFAEAIEQLSSSTSERLQLGKNAREYAVSTLEKEIVLSRFERDLKDFAIAG